MDTQTLPPLPEARIESYQIDGTMRRTTLHTYSGQDMRDYALAAIALAPPAAPVVQVPVEPAKHLRHALELIRDWPIREQDDMPAANMRKLARDTLAVQEPLKPRDRSGDLYDPDCPCCNPDPAVSPLEVPAPTVQPGAVPEGWKLVPISLTAEMEYAAQDIHHILPPRMRRLWENLLAASPPAPQQAVQAVQAVQPPRMLTPAELADLVCTAAPFTDSMVTARFFQLFEYAIRKFCEVNGLPLATQQTGKDAT